MGLGKIMIKTAGNLVTECLLSMGNIPPPPIHYGKTSTSGKLLELLAMFCVCLFIYVYLCLSK